MPTRTAVRAVALALVCTSVAAQSAFAGPAPSPSTYVTNGQVADIDVDGTGRAYLAGPFTHVGPRTGSGVKLTTSAAQAAPGFAEVTGRIRAVVADGSGGWFIGGDFTAVNGMARAYLAHINADGSLDSTWNPKPNGQVSELAISGSSLFVAGSFSSIDGQSNLGGIVKLSTTGSGSVDSSWKPLPSGGDVNAIAASGSDVYVGGRFSSIGGQSRSRIARLSATGAGAADPTWNPSANGSTNSRVYDIVVSGADVYVGGSFTSIGGQSRSRIARLSSTGTGAADPGWDPGAISSGSSGVNSIAISGSDLFVGGAFTGIGGQGHDYLAKLSTTGTGLADPTWNPAPNGFVNDVAVSGSNVYVGGDYTTLGGQAYTNLARMPTTGAGTPDGGWNPLTNKDVFALATSGSDIYAGGEFTSGAGSRLRSGLARLNADGTLDTGWDPAPAPYNGISSLALSGTDLYLAGGFTSVGGQPRSRLARVSTAGAGALDLTWNPDPDNFVGDVEVSGSNVYAAGTFTSIGGQSRNRLAKLSTSGTGAADATWNPNPDSTIETIELAGPDVFVGGYFTSIGGQSRSRIAKISSTGSGAADPAWDAGASSGVQAIEVSGADVLVGGHFTTIGGQPRNAIAKLGYATGAVDPTWNPNSQSSVYDLEAVGSNLFAAGFFDSIGGQPNNSVAKLALSGTGAADPAWDPDIAVAQVLAVSGVSILVGSSFTSVGNRPAQGVASLLRDPASPAISVSASPSTTANGAAVSAQATISGGSSPTGSITFTAHHSSDPTCTGSPLFASDPIPVTGAGTYQSGAYAPPLAGTMRWVATYSGDVDDASPPTTCGAVGSTTEVAKATPTMTTQATSSAPVGTYIQDQASFSGSGGTSNTIGLVQFIAYGPNDPSCSGTPAFTSPSVSAFRDQPRDWGFNPSTAGTYRWRAFYTGDANNEDVSSACNAPNQTTVVTKAVPTITTQATQTAAFGSPISDVATLAGGYSPSGSITYTAYGPDDEDCSETPAYTSSPVSVSGNGNYNSAPAFIPTESGTYRWRAAYSGDVNNDPVAGPCNAPNESSVVLPDAPPAAVDDAATFEEDADATAIPVLANDTDSDGGPKLVEEVTQPANGEVLITGGGTGLTYEPDPDYCNDPPGADPDTFTYELNGNSQAEVSVTITCVDDAPTAVDDGATVAEDAASTAVPVLGNDTDIDGGPREIADVTQPANGQAVITPGASGLTYEPDPDYCNDPPGTGQDTFTYELNGGDTATVSVTVTCADDAPAAINDSASVGEDSGATPITVLTNDTDVDGGTMQIDSVTQPGNGEATHDGTSVTYASDPNYCNSGAGGTPDTFTYALNGGSTASVSVTVTCVDDAPGAADDLATVAEDAPATSVPVLANDPDPDGGPVTIEEITSPPAGGMVTITGGGTGLSYQPTANLCTAPGDHDTFVYRLNGGASATVRMTVTCVDDVPSAVDDSATVAEDSNATVIAVLSNDTDIDGGPLLVAAVGQPANGEVAITGGGSDLTYEPDPNYCNSAGAPDNFSYQVNGDDEATVSVAVTCDVPSLAISDASTPEGNAPGIAEFTVTLSEPEPGGVSVDYETEDGTATAPADYADTTGDLTFTPGQTTKTIDVPIVGDTIDESDEDFTVQLSGPAGASIADGVGAGAIVDDDTTVATPPPPPQTGPTGKRKAALKKCKKKKRRARAICIKKAKKLPV